MGGRAYNYTPLLQFPLHWNEGGMVDGHLHNLLARQLDDIVGNMGVTWRQPVPSVGDLPPTLNTLGDARVVIGENKIYTWSGTAWVSTSEGALTYIGTWNASTNTPTLSDASGVKGHYYVVSTGGTQDLGSGPITFSPGDWAVHNGAIWQKADHTDVVTSVFSRQGAVVALAGDYAASQVSNDSGVAGTYVSDALDTLDAAPPNLHAASHQNGGIDEISVTGLSGLLVDAQTPLGHRASHILGGSDAFLSTDLLDAVVRRIQETGGPTNLLVGAVPDGAGLKRVGTSIIGDPGMAYRCWSATFGSATAAGFSSGSTTPTLMRMKIFPGTDLFGIPIRACIIAESSSGNAGYVDIYRPGTGTIIATIGPITAVTPTIYQFVAPWTNPWPTTEEMVELRVYRGPAAATITAYDFCAGVY